MFKKLISISTATLLFATGLAVVATPANAAPTYTSNPGSVASTVTFAYGMTTTGTAATFTLPSGVTTFDMTVGFSVGSTSTTAARTKALRATFELRDPSNNVMSLSSQGSNIYFYDGINQISNGGGSSYLSSTESRAVPSNATRIDVSYYGYRLTPSSGTTFASGTYSLTPSISFDNTVLPLSTTSTALTLESYSRVSSYGTATSFTNPSVTLLSVFQRIGTCVDTSLVTVGNVLTATTSQNGSDSNPESVRFYNLSTGMSRTFGSTHTLTAADLTSGIIAVANQSIPSTSDLAVTSDISLTVGGVEVSKKCLSAPSTPSLSVSNISLTGTVNNSTLTDGYVCNFYDSLNPNVIAFSKTIETYSSNKTCITSGISGRTYTVTVILNRAIDYDFIISSDASPASTSVTAPFPSVVLTSPSGNTTSGAARLLSIQSAIPTGAVSFLAVSDGGEGLLYSALVPTSNSGCQSNCDQLYAPKIGRLTPTGTDASFAGTGVASPSGTYAVPSTATFTPSAPTIGWYGNRDRWASSMAGSIYLNSGVTLSQGANNSSSISQIALTTTTLNSFCSSTFSAGVTFQQMVAVSMNSSVPVWRLTCTAPSNSITLANGATYSSSLSAAVLVTVTDSSTITPILVLGGLSTGVNGYTFATSVNPTASGSQASLTGVLVTSAYVTTSSQNVVARKIIRITPSLVVTEESSSYSTQTIFATNGVQNTSEPVLTLSDNNNGTVYLTRRITATSSIALATIGASGDITVGQNLTFDSASSTAFPFSLQSISFRGSAQDASSGYLSIVRQNTNLSARKIALQSIEVATGAVTTGEVVSYSTSGNTQGFVNAAHISSTGNLNWYLLSSTSLNAFSQVQWTGIQQVVVNNPSAITNLALRGLTAPVTGATPVTAITSDTQYTGTVTWSNSPSTFLSSVSYVATVTLTAAQGYTLTGVAANSFTATGGTATNSINSGVITVTFPAHTPDSDAEQIAAAAEAAREAAAARVVAIAIAKIELQGVLKDGKSGTLGQYQAADFFPVNEKTVARINDSLLKLAVADRQNAEKIMAIVKAENFVEQVSTTATQKSVTSGQLVDLKLIPATSPNKASVTSAIKKAPVASLTSLAKIQAVIDAHLASLKARKDRTAAFKAKIAARNK